MVTPLLNRRRWQFAGGVAFLACVYLFLTGAEFAASVFASRAELPKLERAVRLSPGNADYRHRLGRYFAFVAVDPQSAIDNLQAAIALNPHDARYWFDLAGAYQVTGDLAGRRAALDRALQAEPTAPDVAWEAANFFLIDGDIDWIETDHAPHTRRDKLEGFASGFPGFASYPGFVRLLSKRGLPDGRIRELTHGAICRTFGVEIPAARKCFFAAILSNARALASGPEPV